MRGEEGLVCINNHEYPLTQGSVKLLRPCIYPRNSTPPPAGSELCRVMVESCNLNPDPGGEIHLGFGEEEREGRREGSIPAVPSRTESTPTTNQTPTNTYTTTAALINC